MEDINFSNIEKKWQQQWEEKKTFEVKENQNKKKYYVLEMFPYPSGSGLHMGHAWNYSIGDIHARFKKMQGLNVLHPMGYDALGLPAENAAIKEGTHPEEYTNKSITNFTKQFKNLGISYDWKRTINTAKPEYYKWDQWIFTKMFSKKLAYQKKSEVNWCPKCNTVLANEQVQNGVCWRHEKTKIKTKKLKQWYLKTTAYAKELHDEIGNLNWPERTKTMQKNWIGKSKGTKIEFNINGKNWPAFTTRPDTIYGVTFTVVSPQHPNIQELITKEEKEKVEQFLKKQKITPKKDATNKEKEGIFTGSYATNPANGKKIPVYTGNFVLADYGTGFIMAVPGHDQRDYDFAKKYGITITKVIEPTGNDWTIILQDKDQTPTAEEIRKKAEYKIQVSPEEKSYTLKKEQKNIIKKEITKKEYEENNNFIKKEKISPVGAYIGEGKLINSEEFNGLNNREAIKKISTKLIEQGKAKTTTTYRLRDWGISRQRYWGTPIPIIHCNTCGPVAVPEIDLPVTLPKQVEFGKGNPLETNTEWLNTTCPSCGGPGTRETDTMDTFANSSWYFLRYCDPHNKEEIFDQKKAEYWNPIDIYIGGAEHACMHLIYFRFYTKFLCDLGIINFREPAKKLFHQGMLKAEEGTKMSKSKGTVILPETVSKKYGTDTARFFLSSIASPDKDLEWSDKGIKGSLKFIKKIIRGIQEQTWKGDNEKLLSKLNKTIANITEHYQTFQYRKATIELRELFETITKEGASKETTKIFLQLINPICPHITEELWEQLGEKNLIAESNWPTVNMNKVILKEEQEEDLTEKTLANIQNILTKTNIKPKTIHLYTIPGEKEKLNKKTLEKKLKTTIQIWSVKEKEKHDPEKKAKKAKPKKPSIYLEE